MTTVTLLNGGRYPEAKRLGPWLEELVADLAPERDGLTVRLAGDQSLRELNRVFRDKDKPTDVLSFPGERSPEGWPLGDVAISVQTARRQAAAAGHSVEHEIRLLALHGVLHCLGYDHESDDGSMQRLETRLRRTWLGALDGLGGPGKSRRRAMRSLDA